MANILHSDQSIVLDLSSISADEDFGGKLFKIQSIEFSSQDADDELILRSGSASGPVIAQLEISRNFQTVVKYFSPALSVRPFLLFSEGVYTSTVCRVIITLSR